MSIGRYYKKARRAVTGAAKTVGQAIEGAGKTLGDTFDSGKFDGSYQADVERRRAQDRADSEAAQAASEQASADAAFMSNIEKERKKRARIMGKQSTILAGALGDSGLSVFRKTLLGG